MSLLGPKRQIETAKPCRRVQVASWHRTTRESEPRATVGARNQIGATSVLAFTAPLHFSGLGARGEYTEILSLAFCRWAHFADPRLLREPFVIGPAIRAVGAREEHRRADKLRRSVSMPVGVSRPVAGHLIIRIPTASPPSAGMLLADFRCALLAPSNLESRPNQALLWSAPDMPVVMGSATSLATF
jgi:hypothetical protein